MYYTLIINQSNKLKKLGTRKLKKLYHFINSQSESETTTYSLRVSYGQGFDSYGRLTQFENEGAYSNKQDLVHALQCFTEVA